MYLFAGKKVTLEEFANSHCNGDLQRASELMDILVATGKAKELPENADYETRLIEQAMKEYSVIDKAEEIESEEDAHKQYLADQKREHKLTYDEVGFEFATKTQADQFQVTISNMRLFSEVGRDEEAGLWVVTVFNLTEKDLSAIKLSYNSQRTIEKTLNAVENTANKTVGAVSYASEQVVVPAVTVVGKGGMSILKTIAKTTVKTGSTLTSAIVHGARDTVKEIRRDPDVIRAAADIKRTANEVKNHKNSKIITKSSGIRIK